MRTLLNKGLIAALALLLTLGAFSGAAWAKTIFVSPTGGTQNVGCGLSTPCRTIYGAVQSAPAVAGDVIQILPGTYNTNTVVIRAALANLTIIGSGQGATVINGSSIVAGNAILDIQANGVTLQSFTIMGATGIWAAICNNTGANNSPPKVRFNPAIRVGTGTVATTGVAIRNVEVTGNAVGIAVCNSSNVTISSNNIHDNIVAGAPNGAGLAILRSNNVTVEANTFFNSPSAGTQGVFIGAPTGTNSVSNTIRSNTFRGFAGSAAGIGAGIELGALGGMLNQTPSNTIQQNTFTIPGTTAANASVGVWLSATSADTNMIEDNVFDGGNLSGNTGIRFNAGANSTTIQRNVFRRLGANATPAGGYGIEIAGTAANMNTLVTRNRFSGNTTGIGFTTSLKVGQNDVFSLNEITQNVVGVRVTVTPAAAANEIFIQNNIENNTQAGWNFVAVSNTANAFLAFGNWWGSSSGPNCPVALACNMPGGNTAIRLTSGDTVNNTTGATPLTTDPFLTTPLTLATGVFGASLSHAPAPLAVPLSISSIRALGLGGHRPGLLVEVRGQGIAGVQLQVFNLGGQMIVDQSATGPRLRWNGLSSSGRTLANGVYLYLVTVRGLDGSVIRSEVRKLVIMR